MKMTTKTMTTNTMTTDLSRTLGLVCTNGRIPGHFLFWTQDQGCHRTSLYQAVKPPPLSTLNPANNQQGIAWSQSYLEIVGIIIKVANLEIGHGMIKNNIPMEYQTVTDLP